MATRKYVYMFDLEGKLIDTFLNSKFASDKLELKKNTIEVAIIRKSCVNSKWYFSKNKDFKMPKKKANFNPLLSKSKFRSGKTEGRISEIDTCFRNDFID